MSKILESHAQFSRSELSLIEENELEEIASPWAEKSSFPFCQLCFRLFSAWAADQRLRRKVSPVVPPAMARVEMAAQEVPGEPAARTRHAA